jgi:hypothetical protein
VDDEEDEDHEDHGLDVDKRMLTNGEAAKQKKIARRGDEEYLRSGKEAR